MFGIFKPGPVEMLPFCLTSANCTALLATQELNNTVGLATHIYQIRIQKKLNESPF